MRREPSRMLQIGKAGEHFVCYDLIINGVNAFYKNPTKSKEIG
jgi:hypothetical protein